MDAQNLVKAERMMSLNFIFSVSADLIIHLLRVAADSYLVHSILPSVQHLHIFLTSDAMPRPTARSLRTR